MKPFKEVIDGIRRAVMASEVREDLAQMGEYVEQFANTAGENIQKAIDPTLSLSGKAADAAKVGEAINAESERAKGVESQIKEELNATPKITQNFYNDFPIDVNAEFNSSSINFIDGEQNAINAPFQKWEVSNVWILENVNLHNYQLQFFYNSAKNKYRSAYRARQKGHDWDTWDISSASLTNAYNFNAPIDFKINKNENSITLFDVSNSNVLNAPFDDWKDGDTWAYVQLYTGGYHFAFLKNAFNPNARYAYNLNGKWYIKSTSTVFNHFNQPFNADARPTETRIYLFNVANKEAYNLPFDDWKDSDTWALENIYTEEEQFQYVKCLQNPFKRQAYRVFGQNWTIYNGNTVVCGEGTSIPDIEQGIARGEATGATVIVRPGNYDLIKMLNISSTNRRSGIKLYNGVHVIFEAGSYVTAMTDGSDEWYHTNFEPFYATGDFTLEGLCIKCKNTRYCVHCEFGGVDTHTYKFINCNMEYTETDGSTWTSGCIGIGLGRHDYIEISGGIYKNILSTVIIDRTEEESYRPIWIHNGINDGCDSKIFIHNVYLPDLGHIELSSYGVTTINSIAQISNSKFGVDVIENFASPDYSTKNIIVVKFNNTIGN